MTETPAENHPLSLLIGAWRGTGHGIYPTIEPFDYTEELDIVAHPKGFLVHQQRTRAEDDGRPLHAETGYWRAPAPGRVELVLAHPTGISELCEGTVDGDVVHVTSTVVGCSATAKDVQRLERWYEIDGDVLRYRLSMAAVGLEHQHHLAGELRRGS